MHKIIYKISKTALNICLWTLVSCASWTSIYWSNRNEMMIILKCPFWPLGTLQGCLAAQNPPLKVISGIVRQNLYIRPLFDMVGFILSDECWSSRKDCWPYSATSAILWCGGRGAHFLIIIHKLRCLTILGSRICDISCCSANKIIDYIWIKILPRWCFSHILTISYMDESSWIIIFYIYSLYFPMVLKERSEVWYLSVSVMVVNGWMVVISLWWLWWEVEFMLDFSGVGGWFCTGF